MAKKINKQNLIKPTESFAGRVFFRPFSLPITRLLLKTSITANQISLLSLIAGLFGLYLISHLDYYQRIVGGLIFFFSGVLDCVDGEIARAKNQKTLFGGLLDTICDAIKENISFIALAYLSFIQGGDKIILILLLVILVLLNLTNALPAKLELELKVYQLEIRERFLKKKELFYNKLIRFFSHFHSLAATWLIIIIAALSNQIIPIFCFMILLKTILVIYILIKTYRI